MANGIEHNQILRMSADREKHIVLLFYRYFWNAWIESDRRVEGQSCGKVSAHAGRVDLWCQQIDGIDLANDVFELKVRAPEVGLPVNVSE
jgi:hypothetical protein